MECAESLSCLGLTHGRSEAVTTARSLLKQVRASDAAVSSTRFKVLEAYALMAGKNKDVSGRTGRGSALHGHGYVVEAPDACCDGCTQCGASHGALQALPGQLVLESLCGDGVACASREEAVWTTTPHVHRPVQRRVFHYFSFSCDGWAKRMETGSSGYNKAAALYCRDRGMPAA